jgi:N-acetylneuraminic acid mutarotase
MHKKSTSRLVRLSLGEGGSAPTRRSLCPARLLAKTSGVGFTRRQLGEGGFLTFRALIGLLLCAATAYFILIPIRSGLAFLHAPSNTSQRTLSFEERVSYHRAIEDVYWRHRIWPRENSDPKPSLDAVMSRAQIEKKVKDYLRNSQALEDYWQRPITAEQLQAEMDRMARNTKQPDVLQELFEALGNDPFVIAECLARPSLAERLITDLVTGQIRQTGPTYRQITTASDNYTLPTITDPAGGCIDDTWIATSTTNAPSARAFHKAVWTGSEMIIWGGQEDNITFNTGGKYSPSTDSWTATSTVNAPSPRSGHTIVWTGSEMIVWGGSGEDGGRYNPGTDSWTVTSATNAPTVRGNHTAVWTGTEMIVWGGADFMGFVLNSGGRYNPSTNSWSPTNTADAPDGRTFHTAVWTGSEMIVWGGFGDVATFNTGGKYDPDTDSWTSTSTANAPEPRGKHTVVWSGSEMIIWGGEDASVILLNTGGKYNPNTDSWTSTSTTSAPTSREFHTVVWTGNEMIVWGGLGESGVVSTGGKYSPDANSWEPTSTTEAPSGRQFHTAVSTGTEMIAWGGVDFSNSSYFNTGGRYCAQGGPPPTPTPTPSVTPTVSPTATPTATPTPTVTPRVTPRPRPTPHSRPTPPQHDLE